MTLLTPFRAVAVAVAIAAVLAFAAAQEPPPLDGARERLDALIADAAALRDDARALVPDLDALALELFVEDPDAIAGWVAAHIAYEPYAGLLRGPRGTLEAGRGNALDQAVLLARLLGDAGYDVEVVLGMLDDSDARRLLASAAAPAAPAPLPADLAARRDALEAGLAALEAATVPDDLRPAAAARIDVGAMRAAAAADAVAVQGLLDDAGVVLGGADLDAALLADARAYAWVRLQSAGADARDLHPLLDPPPIGVAALLTFAGVVPDDLLHAVRVEVVLERRRGDTLEEVLVAGPYQRPAAVLGAAPITLSLAPMRAVDIENAIDAPLDGFVVPVLAGTLEGALAFDPLTGTALAPEDAAAPAAGVVREVARGFGAAAGAVGGGGAGLTEVTAVWFDVTLVAPGGAETTWRRALLDRIGAEHRSAGRVELADPSWAPLRTSLTLTVATGAAAPAAVLAHRLDALVGAAGPARFLLDLAVAPDPDARFPTDGRWPLGDAWGLLAALDAAGAAARPAPTLILRQEGLMGPDDALERRAWVDVLTAPARALTLDADGGVRADPLAALANGVALSRLEAAPLLATSDGDVHTAPVLLAQAQAAGASLSVLRPDDRAALDAFALPAGARAAIAADLEAGRVVILPDHMPDDVPFAWWAVDPVAGDAVGRLADGRGGAISVEYLLVGLIGFNITGALILYAEHRAEKCRMQLGRYVYLTERPDKRDEMFQRCLWGNALYDMRASVRW